MLNASTCGFWASRDSLSTWDSVILFEIVLCWCFTSWFGLLGSAITRALYVSALFVASMQKIRDHGIHSSRALHVSIVNILTDSIFSGIYVVGRPVCQFI